MNASVRLIPDVQKNDSFNCTAEEDVLARYSTTRRNILATTFCKINSICTLKALKLLDKIAGILCGLARLQ